MSMRIGVDVGGTKTLAVAVDPQGRIVASERRATGWGADAVVDGIVAAVSALWTPAEPVVLGIGTPGQVSTGTGVVRHAVNLGIEELDLAAAVRDRLGVLPTIDNDVRAAATGAAALMPEAASLAYLNLGTGVAAGIVASGRPWRGSGGAAGEIGHISVDSAGPACRCGQRGCIEALAGGGALAGRWGVPGVHPVRDLIDAAEAGDPRARGLRDELCRGVAAAVQTLILTTDVEIVVLGGGLSSLGERLVEPVRGRLAAAAAGSPFLRSLRLAERVRLAPAHTPVGALGAALLGAAPAPLPVPPLVPVPEVAARG